VAHELDDAFHKLGRAKEHLKTLRREVEPFEQRDTHTFSFEADLDTGKYTFYVHDLEAVPDAPGWGLTIGDCVHNARTALDYLMVRLVARATQQDPRNVSGVQFPIYDDPKRFANSIGELRKHTSLSGYLARIEELQPFNLGNPSVWGETDQSGLPIRVLPAPAVIHGLPIALRRIALLDNLDKHRVIHATWLAVEFNIYGRRMWGVAGLNPPSDFETKGGTIQIRPLEDGAEVGSVEFRAPLTHEWKPEQVDMKRQFPLRVSLYEGDFTASVLAILPFCLWGVEAVLTLFQPVFADLRPPLPVTAIANPA
jgi:hypothetical protein